MNQRLKKKKRPLPMFWLVLIGSIIGLVLVIVIQPQRESIDPSHLPWNAHFEPSGKLTALGLTINQSTLADAMALYGKDVEVKLFSDLDERNKSIEAYFPVIYIGSIKSALALKLDLTDDELDAAYELGKKITVTTAGGREIELYHAEVAKLLNKKFTSVTLVPRNHLTERAIKMRFGEPDRKEVQSDGLPHWFFDKLGLEMIIDEEGPEALQYTDIKPI
ncbi:MAG: hypothetical protein GXO35_00680 [Gammaproteobacteria bacterium]|nr:hypothetical protein [Gammaproteobacteria bacterium]